jgi:hypothetical protein
MPFRHVKIYDAQGRLLYESKDQQETLAAAYAKAEKVGVPASCGAEELHSIRRGVCLLRYIGIFLLLGIAAGLISYGVFVFTHLNKH